ncbi:VENN motif pre-toxin domain-containing protein, partial [Photorhabdus antumapuensis]|uniref:VENN motif pre-toxin domain-containing protein n=1 Tax=Photorhabdus antumapuensis TaxID=2862867 RepID=UPI00295E7023
TDHANNALSPIFDKEKEQQRLKQAQLIGEISAQVIDIASTEGAIIATKAAHAKLENISEPDRKAAIKVLEDKGKTDITPELIKDQIYKTAYHQALNESGFGTGGKYHTALQAATAAIQGLAGGNIGQALAGGASPYLAGVIKDLTTDPKTHQVDVVSNTLAHAILGAVAAEVSGNNALAGAAGAAGGELAARELMKHIHGENVKVSDLSEEEKQTISTLSTLAAGLAGGIAGDSTGNAVTGAQAGKNAVENNYLSVNELDNFAHQARTCEGESCQQVIKDMVETNIRNQQEMMDSCNSNPNQCAQKYGYLVDQWPVFERTLKNMDRDGTLPVEFRNYLSAVNTLGQSATGKVGELGWTKRFEAMGMSKETAAAMAMTLPIVVEGTKGAKSSPATSSKASGDNKGSDWSVGKGQYSPKDQGTVTNVEHPTGKFDEKSVSNANKGISIAQSDKIAAQAQQNLLNEINGFTSKSQASKNATMVGAYDPVTGKIATSSSNAKITAEALHPDTVKYIEKQLNVKIGEFTSFCKNKAGACAEVSAADQLVRQGVNPSRIKFTDALRPRDVWRKDHIPSDAIIPPCANCAVSWPKGK